MIELFLFFTFLKGASFNRLKYMY